MPAIIGSLFFSYAIFLGLKFLSLTEFDILQMKNIKKKTSLGKYYAKLLKKIFKKYVIFAVVNVCFFIFSWVYLSCFCAVYNNAQIYLIINTIISFTGALLYPFIFCSIPTVLRFFSLRDLSKNREIFYKISRIIQML